MATTTTSWAAFICATILLQAPSIGAGTFQDPKHEHPPAAGKPAADVSAKCQAMMAGHDKMMAEMKAADQRLDALVTTMTAASGQAKVDATAGVVTEIVAQRKARQDGMMKMEHEMMTHMMEHMQAGKESMAMCPMMKMGGMKH